MRLDMHNLKTNGRVTFIPEADDSCGDEKEGLVGVVNSPLRLSEESSLGMSCGYFQQYRVDINEYIERLD